MSAEAAVSVLKAAAPETAAKPPAAPNPLDAAMAATPQPNVGEGAGGTEAQAGQPGAPTAAQRIIAAQRAATGYDHTKH